MIRQEDTRVGRSGIAARADRATFEFRQAEKLERRAATDLIDAQFLATEARHARRDGEVIFQPPTDLVGSPEMELVSALQPADNLSACRQSLVNTLAEPNIICIDASEHRAALATRANVLSQALDASVTAQASNSLEKMLCHQLAVTHTVAMEAFIRLQENYPALKPAIEQVRLMNSAARLLEVFQSGCLTLQKLKQGGTQRVEVTAPIRSRRARIAVNCGWRAASLSNCSAVCGDAGADSAGFRCERARWAAP